ncbi:MAG: XdhC family protein [Acidimicrobiales bacterium]
MSSTAHQSDLQQQADLLRSSRKAFVTATVVRAERPTSAKAGDSALVLDDGTVLGFVGGECARTSVQVQALATLETGAPVLLRITPGASGSGEVASEPEAGAVTVHNPCLSGGTLEIFLEPSVPPSLVVVHGDAPIARAVRELAQWVGFGASAYAGGIPTDADAVVVASHGGDEKDVIESAVRSGVPYVGLIASPRRGAAVLASLELTEFERRAIRTPAGLDIGARTPEEVALSVLAEIVSSRPRSHGPPRTGAIEEPSEADQELVVEDPVCHMSVAAVEGARCVEYEGSRFYFCGSGCENAFRADPGSFVAK